MRVGAIGDVGAGCAVLPVDCFSISVQTKMISCDCIILLVTSVDVVIDHHHDNIDCNRNCC